MRDFQEEEVERLWNIFRNPFELEHVKEAALRRLIEMRAFKKLVIVIKNPFVRSCFRTRAFKALKENPKENEGFLRSVRDNVWMPKEFRTQAEKALKEISARAESADLGEVTRHSHEDKHLFDYDVALSFAGEDSKYADVLAKALEAKKVRVFHADSEKSKLWGEDLYTYLAELYSERARYCVMFLSKHYAEKLWTNHERKAAQSRAFKENRAYILPIRLDKTKIPGILGTIGYIDWHRERVDAITQCVLEKLEQP